MRAASSPSLSDTGLIGVTTGAFLLLSLACAMLSPPLFWLLLAIAAAASAVFLTFRFTPAATEIWLLLAAASLEMTASDLLGQDAFQPAIALIKGLGLGLAVIAVLRYGPRLDLFNPSLAWAAMFAAGMAHGLWPALGPGESLRSLIGSVAPFAFGFSKLSRGWAQTVIRTTVWAPLASVMAAAVLDVAGWRPLFVDSGGLRLAGLGHPAFLAGVCQTAVYACLIELYRNGGRRDLGLLGANLLLLVLTGARAPLSLALAVTGLSLLLVRSEAFAIRHRLLVMLAAAAAVPLAGVLVLGLLPTDASAVRAFQVLTNNLSDLSGRQLLWPNFERAAAASPWVGWGIGAGNVVLPPDGPVARLLQTWAAHNEYLRVEVEGGQIGRALLVVMLVLWVRQHTVRLCASDRAVMRLAFLALAVHAFTDNVLISTPACVLFCFATAVFARGRWEADAAAAAGSGGVSAAGAAR